MALIADDEDVMRRWRQRRGIAEADLEGSEAKLLEQLHVSSRWMNTTGDPLHEDHVAPR